MGFPYLRVVGVLWLLTLLSGSVVAVQTEAAWSEAAGRGSDDRPAGPTAGAETGETGSATRVRKSLQQQGQQVATAQQ